MLVRGCDRSISDYPSGAIALLDGFAEERRSPSSDKFWVWSAIAHQPNFSLRSLIYYQDASSSAIASLDIKRLKSRISTKTSFASLE
jgi:hypothetical protein